MIRTIEVEYLGVTCVCEVKVYGPTEWEEVSIRSEGDLIELLQIWGADGTAWTCYDALLDRIADVLIEEGQ